MDRANMLDDVHRIADQFLRDYIDGQNPQPIAESVESIMHVSFVRPTGEYLAGVTRNGRPVWSKYRQFAERVPCNVMHQYADRIGNEVLAIWA